MHAAHWLAFILFVGLADTTTVALDAEVLEVVTFPTTETVFDTLNPAHPRLLFTPETVARIKGLIDREPLAERIYTEVQQEARGVLRATPQRYEKRDGRRLLSVSRSVKERVRALALVYLLEGGEKYKNRIWKEIEAVAAFPDWNPAHFLDTAEMTHAVALAYDSLYDQWSERQRQVMRQAIVELGLEPALTYYPKTIGWHTNDNNWNQVCNGGIGIGALAIAEEVPELSAQVLYHGIRSIPRAMHYFAPDGGGTEGVTYWSYGTRYNILFLDALRNALGTDFGLAAIPGFEESGLYQLYISGAQRLSFDFGDCSLRIVSEPQHFWLGRHFQRPEYSWFRHSILSDEPRRGTLLDLLWWDDTGGHFDPETLPLDRHFRKAEVASMRSDWGDPNALTLVIQAGKNHPNIYSHGHRHLDLGSFILEALGERWAIDSGRESETYQGHRNKQGRYDFYRTRAEGHNTLVLNPDGELDQPLDADVVIHLFESGKEQSKAVLDLSSAYKRHAQSVRRTFTMDKRRSVTVRDDISTLNATEIWWFMHTTAHIAIQENRAILTLRGKRLTAEILQPSGAVFQIKEAAPFSTSPNPSVQASNEGRRKLTVQLNGVGRTTIEVKLIPEWK